MGDISVLVSRMRWVGYHSEFMLLLYIIAERFNIPIIIILSLTTRFYYFVSTGRSIP